MPRRLYIAAKAPRVGEAKTRLARAVGGVAAITLYRAFLSDIAARFVSAPFSVGWYVTPDDAWDKLAPIVGAHYQQVLVQGAGDWTERQRHLFRNAPQRDEEEIIIIASDSPHITVAMIAAAFQMLEQHNIVIGPVLDGGYYLLGMRGWHDVLQGIPMSTTTVVEQIVARSNELGLSIGLVETTFDIDEEADLAHLLHIAQTRDDLPATQAALNHLGLVGRSALQHGA